MARTSASCTGDAPERAAAYRIYQDGFVVARVEADNPADAAREVAHYVMVYRQDGPVYVTQRKPNGRWPPNPTLQP